LKWESYIKVKCQCPHSRTGTSWFQHTGPDKHPDRPFQDRDLNDVSFLPIGNNPNHVETMLKLHSEMTKGL